MTLLDFMLYDEPRAVLGVAPEELEDATLELPIYAKQLSMELETLYPGLEQLYLETKALPSPSAQEQKLLNVVSVYASYAISQILLTSASLFAPKRITEGKAETDRIADPFQDVRDGVSLAVITLKIRVLAALAAMGQQVTVTTTTRTYFAAAPLSINPITNI